MANKILENLAVGLLSIEHEAALVGGLVTGLAALLAFVPSMRWVWRLIPVALLAGLSPHFILNNFVLPSLTAARVPAAHHLHFWLMVVAGLAVGLGYLRFVVPAVDRLAEKATKGTTLQRNEKTDIRTVNTLLPAVPAEADPLKFWHPDYFFFGLDEAGKPIQIGGPLPHIQVTGTTGTGKGKFLAMMASQCAAMGEAVFFFDPKDDEWAPHVLASCADKHGKKFHLIDLRPEAKPQINLFSGATATEITEMIYAGFSLGEKGSDADHYRLADRRAARQLASKAADRTPASLWNEHREYLLKSAAGLAGALEEMAGLAAVNAVTGLSLENIVKDGGAVYVIGSMRNPAVLRMQRMLLVRLIQLAERRDRTAEQRKICIVLDELKYHISRPALEAMGAARDKGVHLILAHQSVSDLRDCPADLDPEAVVGAIVENAKIKISYRVQDPDTSRWLAGMSGTIQVDDEIRRVSRNAALAETVDSERTIRQAERNLIDSNMFLSLKESQGVMFGAGLPKFIHVSPVKTAKLILKPQTFAGDYIQRAAEIIEPPKKIDRSELI